MKLSREHMKLSRAHRKDFHFISPYPSRRFSKLPRKLFQKLHMCLLSTLAVRNYFALQTAVSQILAALKIAIFGYETQLLKKVLKVTCVLSCTSGWVIRNWTYSCSMDSGFRDTGQLSKLWNLAITKICRNCTCTLFLPQWIEIEPAIFCSTRSAFRDISCFWKFAIFGHETQRLKGFKKLHAYSFYHTGSKFSSFLLYGHRFPR